MKNYELDLVVSGEVLELIGLEDDENARVAAACKLAERFALDSPDEIVIGDSEEIGTNDDGSTIRRAWCWADQSSADAGDGTAIASLEWLDD